MSAATAAKGTASVRTTQDRQAACMTGSFDEKQCRDPARRRSCPLWPWATAFEKPMFPAQQDPAAIEPRVSCREFSTRCALRLWAFHNASDFREAELRAVNLGDDADTTGAVCGQLAGACWGETGIPGEWRDGLARRDLIEGPLGKLLSSAASSRG
ncbi:MAG: ADP-ribosylglycohydrolase family protein [Planctomyces sp.]|nr:ADP-ribosylglycohydrolase family protein [Planctomyces sp.]